MKKRRCPQTGRQNIPNKKLYSNQRATPSSIKIKTATFSSFRETKRAHSVSLRLAWYKNHSYRLSNFSKSILVDSLTSIIPRHLESSSHERRHYWDYTGTQSLIFFTPLEIYTGTQSLKWTPDRGVYQGFISRGRGGVGGGGLGKAPCLLRFEQN